MQTQELQNVKNCLKHLQRSRSKPRKVRPFFSVSNIHVWTENMHSATVFRCGKSVNEHKNKLETFKENINVLNIFSLCKMSSLSENRS